MRLKRNKLELSKKGEKENKEISDIFNEMVISSEMEESNKNTT